MKKLKYLFMLGAVSLSLSAQEAKEDVSDKKEETEIQIKREKTEAETAESNEDTKPKKEKKKKADKMEFPKFEAPSYTITEVDASLSSGINSGLSVMLPNIDKKYAADKWRDFVKEYKASRKLSKDSKVHKLSGDEVKAMDMLIPSLSSNLINVYALFDESDNGVKVSTFYEMEDGAYLTKGDDPKKYAVAELMLKDFGKKSVIDQISNEVEEEEKNLKQRENEQSKLIGQHGNLERTIEKNLKAIERAKETIKKAEDDIVENLSEQKLKKVEVEQQRQVVDYVKRKLIKVQ